MAYKSEDVVSWTFGDEGIQEDQIVRLALSN